MRSGEEHVDTGICNRQLGLLSATRKHLANINYSGGTVPTRLFDRNACPFWKFSFARMEYYPGSLKEKVKA